MNFLIRTAHIAAALIMFSFATPLPGNEIIALGDGESMKFRVGWGIFPHAGEITVNAKNEIIGGLPNIRVTTRLATSGVVRKLYTLEATGDCVFDAIDGRLLAITTKSTSGKKRAHAMAVFNHIAGTLRYDDFLRPERSATLPIPKSQVMDLITALVQTRAWDIKPGDSRPITAIFENDFYDLLVTATGHEKVKTPWGELDTLVLEPKPAPGTTPRGMFKKGATVRVWVSQDARRLPVKFQLGLKYGTGTAHLTDYTPPRKKAEKLKD
ncbi:hypothetical protein M2103_000240 [Ereboglobus sp. PH5-5]|uniref:DUF3108 domain-containing protein n=1 Tax=unclassified Ereboglobus TaxID=2626932 RepID=UPI00240627A4|nr:MULTISPECIES: DUF3108 domain-containing protein [unclassified Ereboglobus]MDF9827014.1 hypothetical protein [Ereboglobus sp. PH5-10]MDF9832036.1 hypothetical protein [Ereboglobus sp. PH5-5]